MHALKHIYGAGLVAFLFVPMAFGQSQQAIHGPATYSGDALMLSPDALPTGYHFTASDEIALKAQEKAIQTRTALLNRESAVSLYLGNYSAAEAEAREDLSLGPNSGVANEILAEALDFQGKSGEALQEYQVMVDAGNRFPRVLLPYALLLLNAGREQDALKAYTMAVPQFTPEDAARISTGSTTDYDLLRERCDFTDNLPQPVELATAIHIALGVALNESGGWSGKSNDSRALAEYARALDLSPNSDVANYYYGLGLNMLGRTAQARVAFGKTIQVGHGPVRLAAINALKNMKHPS